MKGEYSPKLGYIALSKEEGLQEQTWWYKVVWKFKHYDLKIEFLCG